MAPGPGRARVWFGVTGASSRLGRAYRLPKRSLDLLLWATRTREDITLREYTGAEIAGFIEADQVDEETQEIFTRFLVANP